MSEKRVRQTGVVDGTVDLPSPPVTSVAHNRDGEPDLVAYIRSAPPELGELEIDRSEPPAQS